MKWTGSKAAAVLGLCAMFLATAVQSNKICEEELEKCNETCTIHFKSDCEPDEHFVPAKWPCNFCANCIPKQAVLLLLPIAVMHTAAQRYLSHPCGKLACANVSCAVTSQADYLDGEEYMYPGLLCECCGACVNRSVEKGGQCSPRILGGHVLGCSSGLWCSVDGMCVEGTETDGA